MTVISLLFVLLAGSVVVITVLKYLRLPTMLGYLVIGLIVGPKGLAFIGEGSDVHHIAELGVMALMFSLGLKFSFTRLLESRKEVFGLGASQVVVCLGAFSGAAWLFGLSPIDSLLAGAVMTMSSTAVISKILIERGELQTPHGNRTVAVLIFQDLAVIPLLILLDDGDGESANWLFNLVSSVVVLFFMLVIAPRLMKKLVNFFAQQGSNELFTAFVLSMVVGMALLSHQAGLSLILGAFLAGMLLAESYHRYLIEDIIRPFREIFLGFFFISIGLLVSTEGLLSNLPIIVLLSVALLVVKPLIIYGLTRVIGSYHWTAIYSAIALGGTGEFGFVLLAATSLDDPQLLQILLSVNLLCMIMPPVLLPLTERLRIRLGGGKEWLLQARDLTRVIAVTGSMENHVIIVGFGQNAKIVSRMLEHRKIPWVALENNHAIITANESKDTHVVFGDGRNEQELVAAGIQQARVLVVTHPVHSTAIQTIHMAHQLNKKLTIITKVLGEKQVEEATAAGATFMSVSSLETGLGLATKTLQTFGIRPHQIAQDIRDFHGSAVEVGQSSVVDALESEFASRLREVRVDGTIVADGQTVAQVEELLEGTEVELIAIIRDEHKHNLTPTTEIIAGDALYLRGSGNHLDTAEVLLRKAEE